MTSLGLSGLLLFSAIGGDPMSSFVLHAFGAANFSIMFSMGMH